MISTPMDTVSSDEPVLNQPDLIAKTSFPVDIVPVPSTSALSTNQDTQELDGDGNNKLPCSFKCGKG